MKIPTAPLALGLAGLLPFIWGFVTMLSEPLSSLGLAWLGPRFVGPYVQLAYGTVILAFMSGVLWGFSTRAQGSEAAMGYALSTLPALWAFFLVGGGPMRAATFLMLGFVGLLALDWLFWRHELAPPWWMSLRIVLTAVAIVCLAPVAS